MDETLLITGNQSPLSRSLVSRLLKNQRKVIAGIERENEEIIFPDADEESLILLEHERRSPISSRSLFLELSNRKITVNHLLIVQSIMATDETIQSISSRQIEERIDGDIKGFMFLVKEAMAYFNRIGSGSINIVLQNSGPEVSGPMDSLVYGGVEAAANSLFAYYSQDTTVLRGFSARDVSADDFADHICQGILENKPSGRWYPLKNRGGLFSLGR